MTKNKQTNPKNQIKPKNHSSKQILALAISAIVLVVFAAGILGYQFGAFTSPKTVTLNNTQAVENQLPSSEADNSNSPVSDSSQIPEAKATPPKTNMPPIKKTTSN